MKATLETIFGANWRTTLSGLLATAATAIALKPSLVDFLPEPWRGYVVGGAGLAAALGAGAFALNAKDKQVTGGQVQQPEPFIKRQAGSAISVLLCAAMALASCKTSPAEQAAAKARAGRVTVAVLENAALFTGRVALSTLTNVAQQELSGGKIDLAHSAADGLWTQAPSIVTPADVQRVVNAWSGDAMPVVAAAAASAYRQADPQTPVDRTIVVDRLARSISDAAFNATGTP